MALDIDFSDKANLTIYANLFSSTNRLDAFNPATNQFETLTGENEENVAIVLQELSARPGFYTYTITDVSNIPATVNGQFYLIEVFRATGSGFDRSTDTLVGTVSFYWDGEQEVDVCGCESGSSENLTPQEIWEYSDRTLTEDLVCPDPYIELECPDPYIDIPSCPDNSEEIEELRESLEERLEIINNTLEEIKNNQTTATSRVVPNTQTPRINRGTSGQSDIRVT